MIKAFEQTLAFGTRPPGRPVEVEVGARDVEEFIRVAERAGLEVSQPRTASGSSAPVLVAAIVVGALFALIGLQGLNAALGLPRLDAVFSVPADVVGALFTVVGLACGVAVGGVISLSPGQPRHERLCVFGELDDVEDLADRFGASVR
ncbi:MAG TPA: hypothetical protein VHN99_11345 [Deinococcales bacterium]|nr:hypothetical protein [Deinococcales bacterium]